VDFLVYVLRGVLSGVFSGVFSGAFSGLFSERGIFWAISCCIF
jgi:hypothetical protein